MKQPPTVESVCNERRNHRSESHDRSNCREHGGLEKQAKDCCEHPQQNNSQKHERRAGPKCRSSAAQFLPLRKVGVVRFEEAIQITHTSILRMNYKVWNPRERTDGRLR